MLVFAGFDPSGCAGVSADLRILSALEVQGAAVVSAITYQSALEFHGFESFPVKWLDGQFSSLKQNFNPKTVKICMLGSAEAVLWISGQIEQGLGPVVFDPVLEATRGGALIEPDGLRHVRERLIPLVHTITPNVPEAEVLSGVKSIKDRTGMKTAACKILGLGVENVIITGGHLAGNCLDLLYDGTTFTFFSSNRIKTGTVRGIGTLFSAALAGYLCRGEGLAHAVLRSKRMVMEALLERPKETKGPLQPPWKSHEINIKVEEEN